MPASLYESLVKEYLETEGYLVYNNLRIPISGEMQNGNNKWKEIDIFAYSPVKGAIIGESKAKPLNEKGIKDEASKLDREANYIYKDILQNTKFSGWSAFRKQLLSAIRVAMEDRMGKGKKRIDHTGSYSTLHS